jgi:hypothetical protein
VLAKLAGTSWDVASLGKRDALKTGMRGFTTHAPMSWQVVRNDDIEIHQVLAPQHLPNASDGSQSVYKTRRLVKTSRSPSPSPAGQPAAGECRGTCQGRDRTMMIPAHQRWEVLFTVIYNATSPEDCSVFQYPPFRSHRGRTVAGLADRPAFHEQRTESGTDFPAGRAFERRTGASGPGQLCSAASPHTHVVHESSVCRRRRGHGGPGTQCRSRLGFRRYDCCMHQWVRWKSWRKNVNPVPGFNALNQASKVLRGAYGL